MHIPPIITNLSNNFEYVVQWQKENDLVPLSHSEPTIDKAMQFVVGNLAPYIKDIVFFSVTKRAA